MAPSRAERRAAAHAKPLKSNLHIKVPESLAAVEPPAPEARAVPAPAHSPSRPKGWRPTGRQLVISGGVAAGGAAAYGIHRQAKKRKGKLVQVNKSATAWKPKRVATAINPRPKRKSVPRRLATTGLLTNEWTPYHAGAAAVGGLGGGYAIGSQQNRPVAKASSGAGKLRAGLARSGPGNTGIAGRTRKPKNNSINSNIPAGNSSGTSLKAPPATGRQGFNNAYLNHTGNWNPAQGSQWNGPRRG